MSEEIDELFHITTVGRIPEIGRRGLGGGVSQFRGHAEYSRGRTFLTDADGVDFWANRVWEQTEANFEPHDQPYGVPVLLLVDVDGISLVYDKRGSKDCRCVSCIAKEPIPTKKIWLWDGEAYVPIREFAQEDVSDLAEAFGDDHYTVDEDDDLLIVDFEGIPDGWEDAEVE